VRVAKRSRSKAQGLNQRVIKALKGRKLNIITCFRKKMTLWTHTN